MIKDNGHANDASPTYSSPQLSILTFQLDKQLYGLPVVEVAQIIEMVALTHLPEAPFAIQGLINLRGKIVGVMDLRLRFGLPFKPYQLHTPIILINLKQQMLGLIVDDVEAVVEVSSTDLESGDSILPPALTRQQPSPGRMSYLAGVAKVQRRLVPILKAETILSDEEQLQLIKQIALNQTGSLIGNGAHDQSSSH
jgi:purine-binding chemotaxis protein CheW